MYLDKYKKYKNKYIQLKTTQFKKVMEQSSSEINSNSIIMKGGNNDKEIYLIRHGKTIWNELGKTQGQEADIELNEQGIEQAQLTGKYLKKFRLNGKEFDCVLSSPLKRCKKTAKIICSNIEYDKLNIIYMNEIKEVKKGSMSGLTNEDELMKNLNQLAKNKLKLIEDPIEKYIIELPVNNEIFFNEIVKDNSLSIEGVETYEELLDRAEYLIEYIKTTDKQKILVITHSGYLDILLKIMFNLSTLPQGNMSNGKNCSICYCTYKNNIFTMCSPPNTEHLSINLD
jgi:broad specificity phosphatase PhoE